MTIRPYARSPRNYYLYPGQKRTSHKPLILIREFAELHGCKPSQMRSLVAHTPIASRPQPVFRHIAGGYYRKETLEKWWAHRQAQGGAAA